MQNLSVLVLDTAAETANYYITLSIVDALRRHPKVKSVVLTTYLNAIRTAQTQNFDILLAIGGADPQNDVLNRLTTLTTKKVLWTTEDPFATATNAAGASKFDLIYTNDRSCVTSYTGFTKHLPLAASKLFQNYSVLPSDDDYRYDIFFVGTAWPNRVRSLNRILANLPGNFKTKIALPSNQYVDRPALEREDLIVNWRCGNADFANFANKSRVVLLLGRTFSVNSVENGQGTTPPPRLFEAALAGSAQVVFDVGDEVFEYYDEKQISACASEGEAIARITSLINDPVSRMAMAHSARNRTIKEHLYDNRIDQILKDLTDKTFHFPSKLLVTSNISSKRDSKPRILFLTHNREKTGIIGGVELYQEQLAQAVREFDVFFLTPNYEDGTSTLQLDLRTHVEITMIETTANMLTSKDVESYFGRTLVQHSIDIVHIHHLIGLPLSLPIIAKSLGVPVVYHIHDFFLICSRYNLLNHRRVFCDIANTDRSQCDGCLVTSEEVSAGSKTKRDGFVARMISSIDMFIVSTSGTIDYLRKFYFEAEAIPATIIEMVDDFLPSYKRYSSNKLRSGFNKHVAVIGNFNDHKGAETVIELIRICDGENYEFHIIGPIDEKFVKDIETLPQNCLKLKGPYKRQDLPEMLADCDVSLHLSTWPETYMISLTEAWRAGLIPIVTNIGAQGERVKDGINGLVVPVSQSGAVRKALARLVEDDRLFRSLSRNIKQMKFRDIDYHAAALQQVYKDMLANYSLRHLRFDPTVCEANLTANKLGIRINNPDWSSNEVLWDETAVPTQKLLLSLTSNQRSASHDSREILPNEILPNEEIFIWEVTSMIVDGVHLKGCCKNIYLSDGMGIKGFAWKKNSIKSCDIGFIITSPYGDKYYLKSSKERRPELFARFGEREAVKAGFFMKLSVEGVVAGKYQVDLLATLDGNQYIIPDIFVINISGLNRRTPQSSWTMSALSRGEIVHSKYEVAAFTHSFWAWENLLSAPVGGVFRAIYSLPEKSQITGDWFIGLIGPSKSYMARAYLIADDGHPKIQIESRLTEVQPGLYEVSIAVQDSGDLSIYRTGTHLFILPQGMMMFSTERRPSILRSLWIPSRSGIVNVDSVAVSDDLHIFAGSPSVTISGWCFVRGRGLPLYCIATWGKGHNTVYMIVYSKARQDVAVHLRDRWAVSAGFDICLPLNFIERRDFSFYQIYAGGAVKVEGFVKSVMEHLRKMA